MGGVPDRAEGVMAEYIDRDAFIEQKRKQYCGDCKRRKGMKNGKYKTLYEIGEAPCRACGIDDMLNDVEDFPAADVRPVALGGQTMYDELLERLHKRIVLTTAGSPLQDDLEEAADAIEELSRKYIEERNAAVELNGELASKPRWIPVEERFPEEIDRSCGGWSAEIRPSDDVLVWLSHEKRQSVAWYSHTYNEWITVDENTVYCFGEITHWQPLSQPPKEETE